MCLLIAVDLFTITHISHMYNVDSVRFPGPPLSPKLKSGLGHLSNRGLSIAAPKSNYETEEAWFNVLISSMFKVSSVEIVGKRTKLGSFLVVFHCPNPINVPRED